MLYVASDAADLAIAYGFFMAGTMLNALAMILPEDTWEGAIHEGLYAALHEATFHLMEECGMAYAMGAAAVGAKTIAGIAIVFTFAYQLTICSYLVADETEEVMSL